MLWQIILSFHFLVLFIGITVQSAFFQFVVLSRVYDGYTRILCGILGSSQVSLCFSYFFAISRCWAMGFLFENEMCNQSVWNNVFRYFHRYGEFGVVFSIFTLSLDRLISVVYINFHSSERYKFIFTFILILKFLAFILYFYRLQMIKIGSLVMLIMLLFTIFLSITLGLVIMLKCLSQHVYYKTQGTLPLDKRFKLSQSYKLSKNLINPIFICLIFKITLLLSFWLLYFKIIPIELQYQFFSIWNLILNFDTMLFPILFLCSDKNFQKKVLKSFCRKNRVTGIQTLSGQNIQKTDNQCSHFGSLNNEWNA